MTAIIEFLIGFISGIFSLALSFKFELFGVQVSLMSLQLAAMAVILYVSFFKNESPGLMRFARNQFNKSENKKDKKSEYKPKHAKE